VKPAKRNEIPARAEIQHVAIERNKTFSGPLPAPEDLRLYEEALTGAAERIVAMAEAEQRERFRREDFRHEEAMIAARNAYVAERRGQICALVSALCLISGAVVCVVLGAPWVGAALAGTTLVGVVASFLGRWKKSKS